MHNFCAWGGWCTIVFFCVASKTKVTCPGCVQVSDYSPLGNITRNFSIYMLHWAHCQAKMDYGIKKNYGRLTRMGDRRQLCIHTK